jgi:diguanylate cyclase (GGDEF)-like protein
LAEVIGKSFTVFSPVYSEKPANDAERNEFLRGWVTVALDGAAIVRAALGAEYSHVAIQLTWTGLGQSTVVAATPSLDEPTHVFHGVFMSGGRWALRLSASSLADEATANHFASETFVEGVLITFLLAALMIVLLGSRNRALRLVDVRTDELRHQTLHDDLTGLPSRVLALDRVTHALDRGRRAATRPAVLFLDIDNFKAINDTLGHGAGDEVLRQVAGRLRESVRASDTVARLGGDEFIVVLDGDAAGGSAGRLADRIVAAMTEPFVIDAASGATIAVQVSIGIAIGDRADADELVRDADIALYEAKAARKGSWVVFGVDVTDADAIVLA